MHPQIGNGSVAQLNRASDYGSEGCGFESRRNHFFDVCNRSTEQGSVAQLNRASDYGSEGCGFESRRNHETDENDHPKRWSFFILEIDIFVNMEYLPKDPAILVSSVNMLLRDEEFDTLESLCYAFNKEPQDIEDYLYDRGYVWSEHQKQFRPIGYDQ